MPRTFLHELKRRKVYRVAVAYAIVGWLLIQIATQVFPFFHIPDWSVRLLVLLVLAGFPVALVLAWAFDATPHGIVRTDAEDQPVLRRSRRGTLAVGVIGLLLAIIVGAGYWAWHRAPLPRTVMASNATRATDAVATGRPDGAQRYPGATAPASATIAIQSPDTAAAATGSGLRAAQAIPAKSIAVLPFENLSTDKGNAYFADGMQDLILTKLADIGDLKVISRTSTMQYGSHPQNLKAIARQLGVATILEGSVQKAGNQVLINVQLIDAKTDSHLWAESYTRALDNIFGVESEVAQKVAKALNAKLSPAETARVEEVPTHDPVAYDLYLKAQRIFGEVSAGGWEGLPAAIAAYEKVVQRDPTFALAYTKLAFAQLLLNWTGIDRSPAVMQRAEANVRKALALQPDLPQAHVVLGYVYRWRYDDYSKALAEYELAGRSLPNSAEVAAAIGFIRATLGDMPAAIAQLQRATTLDPRNPHWPCQLAVAYSTAGNYVLARQALMQAFAINPSFAEAYADLSQVDLLESGDAAGALALLDRAPAVVRSSALLITARIHALLLKQDLAAARHSADQLRPGHGISALQFDQTKGNVLWLAGARKDAAPFYARALGLLKARLPTTTRPFQTYADLALATARLGHANEARDYGRRMIALAGQKGRLIPYDRGIAPWKTLASAYASMGDSRDAVSVLAHSLARASGFWISVPMLKLDPTWDPIRHDPRFQALLKKYANVAPAAASGTIVEQGVDP